MPKIDDAFTNNTAARFAALDADAKPQWGKLRGDQVVGHLISAFRYSMGDTPGVLPDMSNFVTRNMVGPLLLMGLLPIPKNIPLKDGKGRPMDAPIAEGDAETLREVMQEFRERLAAGTLNCAPHPVFGDIGPAGWDKMHYRHVRHHMRQFGLA